MELRVFISICIGLALIWVAVKAERKLTPPSPQWVSQMAEYCEDLDDSFERLESHFEALAKQYRQAKQKRLAEICQQIADEHDRVGDRLDKLQRAYERLAKELRR